MYAWDILSGETTQLTNIQKGTEPPKADKGPEKLNAQEQWLKNDQLQNMQVLKERKIKKDLAEAYTKSLPKNKELRSIYIDDRNLNNLIISPDGRFISYRLSRPAAGNKNTIIPSYVTENGFTQDINGRTKVGAPLGSSENFVFDTAKDTVMALKTDSIPGIKDIPEFVKDYPKQLEEKKKKNASRSVTILGLYWSPKGTNALVDIRSQDNKDRWIMQWDTATETF